MIPETGSYTELKRAVLTVLPPRKLIGYWVVNSKGYGCGFRMEAAAAIKLMSNLARRFKEEYHIEPLWTTPYNRRFPPLYGTGDTI